MFKEFLVGFYSFFRYFKVFVGVGEVIECCCVFFGIVFFYFDEFFVEFNFCFNIVEVGVNMGYFMG